jgi:hypothetical protein
MQFQFGVTSNTPIAPINPQPATPESMADLLRQLLELQRDQTSQILEVQREHLNHVRSLAQDSQSRWRSLLARWQEDHPEFAEQCKKAYPAMERTYVRMLVNMVEELARADDDAFESDFAVQEFLDRYGMRIGQISHLLSIVGPLAEAAHQSEAKPQG